MGWMGDVNSMLWKGERREGEKSCSNDEQRILFKFEVVGGMR